ncbi:MAG: hypothetical protein ACON47_09600 [Flavobacteriaceae bacterium]
MKKKLFIFYCLFSSIGLAQEITLFNTGLYYHYYEDDKRIPLKELTKRMQKDSLTALHWKKAQIKKVFINGIIVTEIGLLIYQSNHSDSISEKQAKFIFNAFYFTLFSTLWLSISRQKSKRRAILRYNRLLDSKKDQQRKVRFKLQPILMQPRHSNKLFVSGLGMQFDF